MKAKTVVLSIILVAMLAVVLFQVLELCDVAPASLWPF